MLDVPAVCGVYSRLFYDINRQPRSWDCIRPDIGGIPIPGNHDVPDAERAIRDRIVRQPFDAALIAALSERDVLNGIHSFSAVYDGDLRRTEIGVLRRDNCPTGTALLDALRIPDQFVIGDNAPYDLRKVPPGMIDRIQDRIRIPAVILEVRNDLLGDATAIEMVARELVEAIRRVVPLRRLRGAA